LGAGVRTSEGVKAEPSPSRGIVATRTVSEWSTVATSWSCASVTVRFGCVIAVVMSLSAAAAGWIPIASGLVITMVMPAVLVDTQERRLPDVWIAAAAILLLVALGLTWSAGSMSPSLAALAVGTTLMAGPVLVLHLASPTSMGFGDVKLAMVLGGAVGFLDWKLAIPALALAAGSTATVGLCTRAKYMAFGPGLVGGALVALLGHGLLVTT
jgi:leader peptidase (prepilin peptidase) / N-methyltransferase